MEHFVTWIVAACGYQHLQQPSVNRVVFALVLLHVEAHLGALLEQLQSNARTRMQRTTALERRGFAEVGVGCVAFILLPLADAALVSRQGRGVPLLSAAGTLLVVPALVRRLSNSHGRGMIHCFLSVHVYGV